MKKGKNVIISIVVLSIAIISSVFKIDIQSYIDELSASLSNTTDGHIETVKSSVSEKSSVTLEKCVDGDTATFNIDGESVKVRFLAIDTPESVHPYKDVEEYGKDAGEYTCKLLTEANQIEIEYEESMSTEDKYGRKLAWIWVDDELLQESLIEVGYAQVKYIYAKYTYLDKLYEAQNDAKANKVGIWYGYEEDTYEDKTYNVTFKVGNEKQTVQVREGEIVDMIDNPTKSGSLFKGWTYSGELYDLSKGVTRNITLKASFTNE